jgi:bis(5'-adenosyl)-triphosphatase
LLALTNLEISHLFQLARRATDILLQEFEGEGFDWTLQDGEAAGQTVPHVHLHVVPRKRGDLLDGDWHQQVLDSASRPPLSAEELQAVVERLRHAAHLSGSHQI